MFKGATSVDFTYVMSNSLWWERNGWSWTSSEPWSKRKSQRTRWRTWEWCQARSHRTLQPADLRTSHTASWSGTPRWHSATGRTEAKEVNLTNTRRKKKKSYHVEFVLRIVTKQGHDVPDQNCLSRRRHQWALMSFLLKRFIKYLIRTRIYLQYHTFSLKMCQISENNPASLLESNR